MTLLVALRTLVSVQAHGTESMSISIMKLLNYFAMHPGAFIRYKQSDMILAIHIGASYLSDPKACSQAGKIFFLTNKPKRGRPMINNGSVHVVSIIICNVISSAA